MNSLPIEIISFLKEKYKEGMTIQEIKMLLMDELNIRGKDAKRLAKLFLSYLEMLELLKVKKEDK